MSGVERKRWVRAGARPPASGRPSRAFKLLVLAATVLAAVGGRPAAAQLSDGGLVVNMGREWEWPEVPSDMDFGTGHSYWTHKDHLDCTFAWCRGCQLVSELAPYDGFVSRCCAFVFCVGVLQSKHTTMWALRARLMNTRG